jgi:acetyl esterase/lipase
MAYVRKHADELGIDPQRIAAAGGSAGGHLAACVGVLDGFGSSDDATQGRANALVLFNPAVQLAPLDGDKKPLGAEAIARIDARTGGRAIEISPLHHVGDHEPPTLIFHGVDDTTVPFFTVERFGKLMREHGNRCEVVGFKGAKHGFFNARGAGDDNYKATTYLMDGFFASLGWLSGPPTIAMPVDEDVLVREGFEQKPENKSQLSTFCP